MNTPDYKIEIVVRDRLGAIAALITDHGVIDATTATTQISRGEARYVAGPDSYVRTPVKAMPGVGGGYLFANWDGSQRNNLYDLAPGRIPVRVWRPDVTDDEPRRSRILSALRRALRRRPADRRPADAEADPCPCPPPSPANC